MGSIMSDLRLVVFIAKAQGWGANLRRHALGPQRERYLLWEGKNELHPLLTHTCVSRCADHSTQPL
jgi:hypothetical protein